MVLQITNAARFEAFPNFSLRRAFIFGLPGVGKTTIVSHMQKMNGLGSKIVFPLRYSSRAKRPDDLDGGTQFLEESEFPTKLDSGELDFFWKRQIADTNIFYGFPRVPEGAKLSIYGCNNAFLSDKSDANLHIKMDGVFVHVRCDNKERLRRLTSRPGFNDLSDREQDHRLSCWPTNVDEMADIVLDNTSNGQPEEAARELLDKLSVGL